MFSLVGRKRGEGDDSEGKNDIIGWDRLYDVFEIVVFLGIRFMRLSVCWTLDNSD